MQQGFRPAAYNPHVLVLASPSVVSERSCILWPERHVLLVREAGRDRRMQQQRRHQERESQPPAAGSS